MVDLLKEFFAFMREEKILAVAYNFCAFTFKWINSYDSRVGSRSIYIYSFLKNLMSRSVKLLIFSLIPVICDCFGGISLRLYVH